ncbi:MAG: SPFH domain-containing protein [Longibaculum sp.]
MLDFVTNYLWIVILVLLAIIIIARTIRIVPQSYAYVVERIGAYNRTCNVGLHILIPLLDRIANKVSLKEQVMDFAPQPVITKDNVTMQIDTVVYFQITDPKLFTYGVVRPLNAIENLTATTLRNIIGDLELDETLTSRDIINSRMRSILDEATDPWGIKIHRVEVKNIIPPRDIQEAMEKQMRAERERREAILQAEGKKTAAILTAEGKKESMILEANAEKEAQIARAEGEAEALRLVYEAQAKGIEYINTAGPKQAYLTLEGFKALEKLSEGEATKIIIPSELQGLASAVTSIAEIARDPKKTKPKE